MRRVVLCVLVLLPVFSNAQKKQIDSLNTILRTAKHDTSRAAAYIALCDYLFYKNNDTILPLCQKAIALAESHAGKENERERKTFNRIKAEAIGDMGYYYKHAGNLQKALELYEKAVALHKENGEEFLASSTYLNIGQVYWQKGETDKALEYTQKSYRISELARDIRQMAIAMNNLGNFYLAVGNSLAAIEAYFKALRLHEKTGDKYSISTLENNIGMVYSNQGENEKARDFLNKALAIQKEIGDRQGEITSLQNLGLIDDREGKLDVSMMKFTEALKIAREMHDRTEIIVMLECIGKRKLEHHERKEALPYLQEAFDLAEKGESKESLAQVLNALGSYYVDSDPLKAEEYLNRSLEIGRKSHRILEIKIAANALSTLYTKQNKFEKALEMYRLAIQMRDSMNNDKVHKASLGQQFKYEYEKKEAMIKADQDKKDALSAEELQKQNIIIYSVSGGLILMGLLALFILRGYRQKQRANTEISAQKAIIEEKQKEILDSIAYAKYLQSAILPSDKQLRKFLPGSFVLYKAKDIVAGDFYWMETFSNFDFLLIAAADCTGHGVPGAMVSVVCSNAMNRAVKEFGILDPGKILDKVRELVIETFEKSEKEVKDGMDISLCSLNLKTRELKWAGANNPLWFTREGKLVEIQANKQPVGKSENPKPFDTHSIHLDAGDSLFLFTDGFADQFGGPKGKKFKYKPLQNILLSNADKDPSEQKILLEKELSSWQGNLEQVDDILVIGIRV